MSSLSITPAPTTAKPSPQPISIFSGNLPVFPDSGGTLSILPDYIVRPLVANYPGATSAGDGLYEVPCSTANQTGFVDFGFGEKIIRVPWKEFVWFAGPNACALGIMSSQRGDVSYVLGDTFLRAAFGTFQSTHPFPL